MFKKLLISIATVAYVAASCGLIVSTHYCMGRESGATVSAGFSASARCGKCGMPKRGGCCNDKVKVVSLKTFSQQPSCYQLIAPGVAILPAPTAPPLSACIAPVSASAASLPLSFTGPPLIKLHCTYRI